MKTNKKSQVKNKMEQLMELVWISPRPLFSFKFEIIIALFYWIRQGFALINKFVIMIEADTEQFVRLVEFLLSLQQYKQLPTIYFYYYYKQIVFSFLFFLCIIYKTKRIHFRTQRHNTKKKTKGKWLKRTVEKFDIKHEEDKLTNKIPLYLLRKWKRKMIKI